jgi:hypothetical protein
VVAVGGGLPAGVAPTNGAVGDGAVGDRRSEAATDVNPWPWPAEASATTAAITATSIPTTATNVARRTGGSSRRMEPRLARSGGRPTRYPDAPEPGPPPGREGQALTWAVTALLPPFWPRRGDREPGSARAQPGQGKPGIVTAFAQALHPGHHGPIGGSQRLWPRRRQVQLDGPTIGGRSGGRLATLRQHGGDHPPGGDSEGDRDHGQHGVDVLNPTPCPLVWSCQMFHTNVTQMYAVQMAKARMMVACRRVIARR